MASRSELLNESMIMRDIDGRLSWIIHVGRLENKKLYQVDHEWLYGQLNKK